MQDYVITHERPQGLKLCLDLKDLEDEESGIKSEDSLRALGESLKQGE